MFFRMIFGLPGAAIITGLLFLAMAWMVRQQESQIVDPGPTVDSILSKLKETPPDGTKPPPSKLPPAPEPVKVKFPKPIDGPGPGVIVDPIPGPTGGGTGPIGIPIGTPSVKFAPVYPENCRARGAQGVVMVEFDVTAEGTVINPRVVASENSCLDRAAINTIVKWKFQPQTDSSGRPVPQRGLRQTFNFQLTD